MITLRGMTWDHPRGYDPMVTTSAVYTERHRDIRIIWEKRPLQAFADRPIETMADTYDLMVIDHPHIGEAARKGLLINLGEGSHAGQVAEIGDHSIGQSHVSYAIEGGHWALAIDAAAPVASWRPDRIDAPPETWQEVVDLADAGKVIWPLKPVDSLMSFFTLARNLGIEVGNGGRLIDTSAGEEVLGLIGDMVKRLPERCLSINPIETYEWLAGDDGFAYCPLGYGYTNYARPGFRDRTLRFADIAVLGDQGPAGSCLGGAGLAISALTDHQDIALDYALWVAGAECQKGLFFNAGGQPGHRAAWDDARCNDACSDFFRDTLATHENAWVRPRHAGYLDFQDEGGTLVNSHLKGEIDRQATVRQLNEVYALSLD
jgi:multiple sugar transport system substrate-binding protein